VVINKSSNSFKKNINCSKIFFFLLFIIFFLFGLGILDDPLRHLFLLRPTSSSYSPPGANNTSAYLGPGQALCRTKPGAENPSLGLA
jgi:hypothetical protein